MFLKDRQHIVAQGTPQPWAMQGQPGRNAGLDFSLQFRNVLLPDGSFGLVIDPQGTLLPGAIQLMPTRQTFQGQVVWSTDDTVTVVFEGSAYELVAVKEVGEANAKLYYHTYPPRGYNDSNGDVVFSSDQLFEAFIPGS
jgi:hypothetical protein